MPLGESVMVVCGDGGVNRSLWGVSAVMVGLVVTLGERVLRWWGLVVTLGEGRV